MPSARHPRIAAEAVTISGQGGARMFGIVSRPSVASQGKKALIILGKAAPGDVWRWLAESLARAGWIVLRFEPCGLGDSPGGNADVDVPMLQYFRAVQEGAYTAHVEDAVDWMRQTYQPDEIHLCGICANCSSVLAAAASRTSVTGVILSTPAVLYVQLQPTLRPQDAACLVSGYGRRLFSPAAYVHLLTGRSAYQDIWQSLRWLVGRPQELVRRALARLNRCPKPSHPHFNQRFWEAFRAVMERRTPVLALLAENDGDALDFARELKEPVIDRSRQYRERCTVRVLAGADHSLVADKAREQMLAAVLEWFGSLEEPPRISKVG
jgi:alpha-beta hydrolase superfamily lysophospholipase